MWVTSAWVSAPHFGVRLKTHMGRGGERGFGKLLSGYWKDKEMPRAKTKAQAFWCRDHFKSSEESKLAQETSVKIAASAPAAK